MRRPMAVLAFLVACSVLLVGTAVGGERRRRAAPTMHIRIVDNSDFDEEHGVSSGTGTKSDPYVFEGLEINSLHIENTDKYVEIKKSRIAGNLVLDWIGDRAEVHANTIGRLHVNRNVRRTGAPTSGSIVRNRFDVVLQLRHWDGVFAHNTVGTPGKLDRRGANFDGFNGARFDRNTIYGWVDARLHGHHHSSGFDDGSGSHDHSAHMNGGHAAPDHSQRYHRVSVTNNVIHAKHHYGLAYLDTRHAGNDRTAPSERDKALNEPHAHHTRMRFAGNKLMGAGILVDVFNADDGKHTRTYEGAIAIENNRIALGKDDFASGRQLMGIDIRKARDVHTRIAGNRIVGWRAGKGLLGSLERWDRNAGILLQDVDKAHVMILSNYVENRTFGIHAKNFTLSVHWTIGKLVTKNVDQRVAYENVPRQPDAA